MASFELKSYRTERGCKSALIRISGPKWMHVLVLHAPLSVQRVPVTEQRFMTDLIKKNKPYPLNGAIKVFRRFGKASGITKGAKRFLIEASQSPQVTALRRRSCLE